MWAFLLSFHLKKSTLPTKKVVSDSFSRDRGCPVLLARMDVVDSYALLAADVAAPVEDAVTFLLPFLSPRVVAAPAAQEVTTVYAVRGDVTDPVPGTKGTCFGIGLAEVRGVLIVDQISFSRCFEEVIFGTERLHPAARLPVLFHDHFRSTVVFVLQVVTDDPEVRLGPPAGLHLAAA